MKRISDEEINSHFDKAIDKKGMFHFQEFGRAVAQAQLDFCEKECQEIVDKIFEELETIFPWIYQGVNEKPWQALKQRSKK